MTNLRVGQGFDLHRLLEAPSAAIRLGGVDIPANYKVVAHSDGDVVVHALCDALLGAAALGDIGQHFSDRDARYRNINSMLLLAEVVVMLDQRRYAVVNCDITVLAEAVRIAPHGAAIQKSLAQVLRVSPQDVGIKAKTMEGLGSIGDNQAIAAQAVALIHRA